MKKLIADTLNIAQVRKDSLSKELVGLIKTEADFKEASKSSDLDEFFASTGTLNGMVELNNTLNGSYLTKEVKKELLALIEQTKGFAYVMFTDL